MKTKAKPVPMVTKWWTVVRRMQSGTIGMESVGPVKAFENEKPYAMMPWNYYRAVMKIVREKATEKCKQPKRVDDPEEPMLYLVVDCGKCAPCLARKLLKATR